MISKSAEIVVRFAVSLCESKEVISFSITGIPYTYSMSNPGKISICVILRNTGIVFGYYYSNNNLLPPIGLSNTSPNINFQWGSSNIFGTYLNSVSIEFKSYLRPSVSGLYTISVYHDDGATVMIDGINYMNLFCQQNWGTGTFTVNLNSNTDYFLYIKYCNVNGQARLALKWTTTVITNDYIPASNYVWPQFVGSSPYTINIISSVQNPAATSPSQNSSPAQNSNDNKTTSCSDW